MTRPLSRSLLTLVSGVGSLTVVGILTWLMLVQLTWNADVAIGNAPNLVRDPQQLRVATPGQQGTLDSEVAIALLLGAGDCAFCGGSDTR